MRKVRRNSIQVELSVVLTSAISVLLILGGVFLYFRSRSVLYKQLTDNLQTTSDTAALLFDAKEIIHAIESEEDSTQSFRSLREVLKRIQSANPKLRYVYLILSPPSTQGRGLPMRYIVEPEAAVVEKHGVKKSGIDEKGSWVAASSPIIDSNGNKVAILGMNISAGEIAREEKALIRLALIFIGGGVLLSLFVSALLSKGLTAPIEQLVKETERIADGDLSGGISSFKRKDELGELAEAFNKMITQLKTSQDEIRAWNKELERRVDEKTRANLELQERLAQAAKMGALGQLSAGIAHELRNPLGIISSSVYYLREHKEFLSEDFSRHLSIMERNIERSEKIIKSLLEFSKTGSISERKVDLNSLLEENISLLRKDLIKGQIKLKFKKAKSLPSVYGNADGLRQAIFNILLNAVQAMPSGGELMIETGKLTDDGKLKVFIRIKDSGVGIKEEHLNQIFNPFFTTKEPGEGIGLGLSIAYSIVERHRGTIRVKSDFGKGSSFTIELPLDRRKEET